MIYGGATGQPLQQATRGKLIARLEPAARAERAGAPGPPRPEP